MGRFEKAAEFYRHREPYPAAFFEKVAEHLQLSRSTRLLDIGCGPGNLAIGFAPFVGTCTGVDQEAEMLSIARRAASAAAVEITFVETSVQNFDSPANSFDFVTIGRALHWLPSEMTLPLLERVLTPAGYIAICGSQVTDSPVNQWAAAYDGVRRSWSSDPDQSRYKIDFERWFAGSRFRKSDEITVKHQHRVSVPDLIARALSFSTTSPDVVGKRRPLFEAEIRDALQPFAKKGEVEEELLVKAMIFR